MPVAIGLADLVVGDPHIGKVALTVVASTSLVYLLALLGRRLGGPSAGVATAWLAAVMPGLATMPQIRGTGSEAEYTLLVVSALWCTVSAADRQAGRRHTRLAGGGLLLGLAYLARPEGLAVGVPLAVGALVIGRRDRSPGAGPARALLAFLAPLALCVVPYAAYLHANTGSWQLTAKTQDASIEAWHAVARGDRAARNEILYALDDRGTGFSARYSPLASLARDHPGEYASILGTNVERLGDAVRQQSLVPPGLWFLALWGAWCARRSRAAWLVAAVAVIPVASALAFFVQQRYLLVTLALATVAMGVGVARFARPWRGVVGAIAVGLALWASVLTFRGDVAGWWHPVEQTEQRRAGEWIADNADAHDRVMTRSMIVDHYAERTAVALPHAPLDRVLAFARHYGVRYVVADWYTVERLIPDLAPLLTADHTPGLRLVHEVRAEGRAARIYELDPVPPASALDPPALGFTGDG